MHVLMLLEHPFPPDVRLEKEIASLEEAGCRVTVVAEVLGDMSLAGRSFTVEPSIRFTRSHFRMLDATLADVTRVQARWLRAVISSVEQPIDAVHVHDLPLARTGWLLARAMRAAFVLDLHESYPSYMAQMVAENPRNGWRSRWTNSVRRLHRYERWAVRHADRVIGVSEPMSRRLELLGADRGVAVVPNTASLADFPIPAPPPASRSFLVGYAGSTGAGVYELEVVLRGLALVSDQIPDVQLRIVGGGPDELRLRILADEAGVGERVQFTGRIPRHEVGGALADCRVCVLPLVKSQLCDHASSNKLFEYMALGRPVVVSDVDVSAEVVRSAGCGLIYRPGDPSSFAYRLSEYADEQLAARHGQAGRRAFEDRYTWDKTVVPLLDIYSELSR